MAALVEICRHHLTTVGLVPTASCSAVPAAGQHIETDANNTDDEEVKKPTITADELIEMTSSIATLPNIYFELKNVMNRRGSASVDMAATF